MRHYFKNDWIKFVAGWAIVFAVRLIPFRVPNIEPLTAVQMPFAKRFGWAGGFLFGFLSIVFFDAVTSGIGVWTWVTAFAFGALGTGAGFFFGRRPPTRKNFLVYAVLGTIAYDAVTGLSIGPLFWGQSFSEALSGQIPFTLYHLAGNAAFSVLLSPLIYQWIVENKALAAASVFKRIGFSGNIRPGTK